MPGSVIDSFLVALGFKVDAAGIDAVKAKVDSAKESMLSWGTALTGIVAGLAIHEVAKIGSTFEQNRIQIAGFLSALGKSSDFNAGLKDAAGVIQQITNDAAKLPGEADEYIEVFKAGFPFVQGAMPGGSLTQMTDFTNKLTAIGKTFGLDAGIISREFDHMLSPDKGMASLRLPLFRQLLPFMKQVEGHAKLTAESFNQMTAPQRLQLLQASFAKLQPMLDASADSFDAMWGALVSNTKQLTRMGTEGLFSGMKKALDQLNGMFFKADGSMTEFGKNTVAGIAKVTHVISQLLIDGMQFVAWLGQVDGIGTLAKTALGALGVVLAGLAFEKAAGKAIGLFKAMTNIKNLLTGGMIAVLFLVGEDLWGFYHGANSVTGVLVDKLGPGILVVAAAVGGLALAFTAMKIQAIAAGLGVAIALWPITLTIAAVAALAIGVYELKQHWQEALDFMEGGLNRIVVVLNKVIDVMNMFTGFDFGHIDTKFEFADKHRAESWAQGNLAPGAGVMAPAFGPQVAMGGAVNWASPSGFSVATAGRGAAAPGTVHHGDIHIHTPTTDPHEHGEIVRRVMRTNAKGYVR